MGVHGLWKLLEPAGRPVPVENLENKILAVDVSIWLHQLTKGFQSASGGSVPNAHLVGLFNRICKLLYYRIRPVFVFDGGVPYFKKDTIDARRRRKRKALDDVDTIREKMLQNLLQKNAISQVLGSEVNFDIPGTSGGHITDTKEDIFKLPPSPEKLLTDLSDEENDAFYTSAKVDSLCYSEYGADINNVDVTSKEFKALPPALRHDILTELQATRKQNSWSKVHEMPEDTNEFSNFQLKRLLKRHTVQLTLDETAKELSTPEQLTFSQLEDMFRKDGLISNAAATLSAGRRIASDDVTRCIYITNEEGNEDDILEKDTRQIEEIVKTEKQKITDICESEGKAEEKKIEKIFDVVENVVFKKTASSDSSDLDDGQDGLPRSDDDNFHLEPYLLNNSDDLSQEQILQVIRQEQNNKITVSEHPVEEHFYDSVAELTEITDQEVLSSKTNPLSAESNRPNVGQIKITDNTASSSSSDSDDFIEVTNELDTSLDDKILSSEAISRRSKYFANETDILNTEANVKKKIEFTVTIRPNQISIDDDIFSDVFSNSSPIDDKDAKYSKEEKEINSSKEFLNFMKPSDNNGNSTIGYLDDSKTAISTSKHILETSRIDKDNIQSGGQSTYKKIDNENDGNSKSFTTKLQTRDNCENNVVVNETLQEIEQSEIPRSNADVSTKRTTQSNENLSFENLIKKQSDIEEMQKGLQQEHGKQERLGSSISEQMVLEAQELLRLFGIPFVVAPMEAEAQCAFMDKISLTEGTITDDSDIWLFGGQKVYKNFFDNRKFVLNFRYNDIENFFKLTREQMIQLALLVGSDYTVGLTGVGPVTAMEILASFKKDSSTSSASENVVTEVMSTLENFKQWWKSNRKKEMPLTKKLKDVVISESFPNAAVINAYLYPSVDDSKETFSWASPDLERLREYTSMKFGWKKEKSDQLLLPVMKRLINRNKQSTLETYFTSKIRIPNELPSVSKRVQTAVNKLRGYPNTGAESKLSRRKKSKADETTSRTDKIKIQNNGKDDVNKIVINPDSDGIDSSSSAVDGLLVSRKLIATNRVGEQKEFIPQRERDREDALKRRAEAISILKSKRTKSRKSARTSKPIRTRKSIRTIKSIGDANLSETSSEENY